MAENVLAICGNNAGFAEYLLSLRSLEFWHLPDRSFPGWLAPCRRSHRHITTCFGGPVFCAAPLEEEELRPRSSGLCPLQLFPLLIPLCIFSHNKLHPGYNRRSQVVQVAEAQEQSRSPPQLAHIQTVTVQTAAK